MYYIKIAGECMLNWDLEYFQGIFLIRLKGSLNKFNNERINDYLVSVIKKMNLNKIVINLAKLENIDYSGINALLNVLCTVKEREGIIYFCELNPGILKRLCKYHIKIISSEKTALKLARCDKDEL